MKNSKNYLRMADGGESALTRWANRMVGNNPKAQQQRGRSEEYDSTYVPPAPPATKDKLRMMDGGSMFGDPLNGVANGASSQFGSSQVASPMAAARPMGKTNSSPAQMQTYQPMMAMPQQPLTMADGGMFSSLRKMMTPETSAERYARHQAKSAAPVPAPAPAAPASAPVQGSALDPANALRAREKAAGLRDGGDVPGKGSGDKIPALYEPGEFVVSNDMLERKPGLRDALHDLRAETLASQGKTVEEADAAALGYDAGSKRSQGVRAVDGFETPGRSLVARPNFVLPGDPGYQRPAAPPAYTPPPVNPTTGKYIRSTPSAPADVTPRTPTAAPKAGALRAAGNFVAGAGESAGSVGGAFKNVAGGAGGILKGGLRMVAPLVAPYVAGASIVDGFNTDTETYAKRFGLENTQPGVLRDVGVRALGVASDVGNNMTGGLAKQVAFRDDGVAAQPLRAQAQPQFTPSRAGAGRGFINPTTVQGAADLEASLGGLPRDLSGVDAGQIYKTKGPNGGTVYSGRDVKDGARMVGSLGNELRQRGTVSSVPGMDPALIERTLSNPDGSRWTDADNSRMAANLRDGANPYAGTSRAPQGPDLQALALSPKGTPGRKAALAVLTNQQNNATTLRGQDLNYEVGQTTARQAAIKADLDQKNRLRSDARADKTLSISERDAAQKYGFQAESNARRAMEVADPDGKINPGKSAAAFDEVMRATGGRFGSLDEPTRQKVASDAKSYVTLLESARGHQNNGWLQALGFANSDTKLGGLPSPEDLAGAKLTDVGYFAGSATPNVSPGDRRLTLKDGRELFFGREDLTEAQIKYLAARGVKLGDK